MGFDTKLLPQAMIEKLPPAERRKLGRAGLTRQECKEVAERREEKAFQNDIANLLRQRNLFFVRSRMDKKTTTLKGLPDFLVVLPRGRALMMEAKVEGGELSEEQKQVFSDYWRQTGDVVYIVLNLPMVQALLDEKTA